jgi:iron complex transport system substrate-binding protein
MRIEHEPGSIMPGYPRRIVCLTEEPTEILYLLGEGDRVVGVSGYTVRPPEARSKPRISAFTTAKYGKICSLEPDLVIGFSDLQADIGAELVRRGIPVMIFNQRTVTEILQTILLIGGLVGCAQKAEELVSQLTSELDKAQQAARQYACRPRVYFEEWMDPLISGICWVEELIELAGGDPVFPELRKQRLAKDRILDPVSVVDRNPHVIIASWCGRRLNPATIRNRPGWQQISAIRHDRVFEIKSTYILQPGPASLTEGLRQLREIISATAFQVADEKDE